MPIVVDPNIAYLILLVGLWLSVTAAYVPGTGLIEVLAGVGVVISVVVLGMLPTNWLAVVVFAVGALGFFIIPLVYRHAIPLALGGLMLQVIGGVTLFNGLAVSLPLIVIITVLSLLYFRFGLIPVFSSQQAKPALIDDQPIIGERGYVQTLINPIGTVRVRGESWTARSDHRLETGTGITVIDQEGLTLFVEADKLKRQEELETA